MIDLLNTIFSAAYATQSSQAAAPPGNNIFILLFVVFILFVYWTVWRPQNKRAREQQALLNALAKDDEVLLTSGIIGKINQLDEQYLILFLTNNTTILVQKTAVVTLLPKGSLLALSEKLMKSSG